MTDDGERNRCARAADYFSCRLMPHGGPVLFPVVLATLGLCAVLVDDGCDYARLSGAGAALLTGSDAVPWVDVGMTKYRVPSFYPAQNAWRVAYADECRPYDAPGLLADARWVAAEWLRFMSLSVGGGTALFLWTSVCLTLRPKHWRAAGVGAGLACLLEAGSFVWFRTRLCRTSVVDYGAFEAGGEAEVGAAEAGAVASSCALFFGARCAVVSCVLWAAAAGVLLLGQYPPPVPKYVVEEREEEALTWGVTDAASGRGGHRSLRSSFTSSFVTSSGGSSYAADSRRSSSRSSLRKSKGSVASSFNTKGPLTASVRSDPSSRHAPARSHDAAPWAQRSHASLRASGRTAAAPPGFVRPKELSGSEFSAVSMV